VSRNNISSATLCAHFTIVSYTRSNSPPTPEATRICARQDPVVGGLSGRFSRRRKYAQDQVLSRETYNQAGSSIFSLYQLYIQPPSTPSFYSFVCHSFLVFFVTFIFVSSKGYSSSYLFGSIKVLCGLVIKDWIRCAPPPRFFKEKTSGAAATAAPVESSITWFEMQPSNRFPQTLRYRTKKEGTLIEHTVNLGSLTTCFFNSIC